MNPYTVRNRPRSYKRHYGKNGRSRYMAAQVALREMRAATGIQRYYTKRVRNGRTGGFLGIETKFKDSTYPPTAIAVTITGAEADPATLDSLSAIAQGDGETQRDGRKCTLTSLHMRGQVTLSLTAGSALTASREARVVVVWDTQTNGAQLNAEDVILAATNVEHGFRNLQFTKRFKILKDQNWTLNPLAAAGDGAANDTAAVSRDFKWNFPLKIPVIHNGTTAVVANITDNSLHVIAFASGTGVTLQYESRVRFVG